MPAGMCSEEKSWWVGSWVGNHTQHSNIQTHSTLEHPNTHDTRISKHTWLEHPNAHNTPNIHVHGYLLKGNVLKGNVLKNERVTSECVRLGHIRSAAFVGLETVGQLGGWVFGSLMTLWERKEERLNNASNSLCVTWLMRIIGSQWWSCHMRHSNYSQGGKI